MNNYVINHRKFDLTSYKPKAFNRARLLFIRHNDISLELNELRKQISSHSYTWDTGTLMKSYIKRDKMTLKMAKIERELIELDENFWNHKGLYKKKAWNVFKSFITSEWFPLSVALGLVLITILSVKNNESIYTISIQLLLVIINLYNSRNLLKQATLTIKEMQLHGIK